MKDFKPQGLANTLWAMATMKVDLPEISKTLCAEAAAEVKDFNPQNLANTLCAMAKMQVELPEISKTLCAEAAAKVKDFNPQKLANFPEVEAFVLVACEQAALVDGRDYLQPVITPLPTVKSKGASRSLLLSNLDPLSPVADDWSIVPV